MSDVDTESELAAYIKSAESWASDRSRANRSAMRAAWLVAGLLGTVALAEAFALVALLPLKTVVPYTLLVDRQTGYVQALKPLDQDAITPDQALTRSFLAQYVIAREGFDIATLKDDYRKVALWSTGDARDRYVAGMQAGNPASPLATLPRKTLVEVEVRGISSLSSSTALVRFVTTRIDPGGQPQPARPWQAVVSYRFSGASMSAADRLLNPLGFQVLRYRRDAEFVPEPAPAPSPVAQSLSVQPPSNLPPSNMPGPAMRAPLDGAGRPIAPPNQASLNQSGRKP